MGMYVCMYVCFYVYTLYVCTYFIYLGESMREWIVGFTDTKK